MTLTGPFKILTVLMKNSNPEEPKKLIVATFESGNNKIPILLTI
jgi:hypothetical protein